LAVPETALPSLALIVRLRPEGALFFYPLAEQGMGCRTGAASASACLMQLTLPWLLLT